MSLNNTNMRNNNTSNNNFNKKVVAKPFCKVCFDAGKPEAEYTSHFVKSEPSAKGKVVCPTLLNQACTYCRETGHTVSHCAKLKQNNKNKEHALRVQEYAVSQGNTVGKNVASSVRNHVSKGFAALRLIDEEADQVDATKLKQLQAYPPLCDTPRDNMPQIKQLSYASMAAKTVVSMDDARRHIVMPIASTATAAATAAAIATSKKTTEVVALADKRQQLKMKSWADWSDSDDDEEEEDEKEESDCECGHCDF